MQKGGKEMDDLISRQAAIDAVAEGLKRTFVEYRDVAEKMLNKVPSAQPERIKGRWIKNADENCWWYECSECGDYPMKNAYGHEELSAYCPHCGAIMEGEEDERTD